ncbi:MAG: hypothetical protein WAT70_14750 [Rhizobiaceae bacterium]
MSAPDVHAARTPPRRAFALVVSEKPVDRIIYGRMLELAGLQSDGSDFASAAARCAERRPEIILFDQSLADPSLLTSRIAKLPADARPKIIAILTPGDDSPVRPDLHMATVNKPVTVDSLLPVIRGLLEN